MKAKEAYDLVARYVVLGLLGTFNLKLFYLIFTPLTVYPVFWIVSLFTESSTLLPGNILFFSGLPDYVEIIPACIAGAAYYLLIILNLSTPMEIDKRMKSLGFILLTFLVLNVARILIFIGLLNLGYQYFDIAHSFVWYFGSTILIILIWFLNVWMFKIQGIPVYTDFKRIFGDIINVGKGKGE